MKFEFAAITLSLRKIEFRLLETFVFLLVSGNVLAPKDRVFCYMSERSEIIKKYIYSID